MKEILVTGAKGQLGSCLKDIHFNYPSYKFYFTDYEELDICSEESINEFLDKHNISSIVNCAAYTAVDKAETEQEKAYNLNANAPKLLSIQASKRNIHLIHISTDYVFDNSKNTPISPLDKATNPKSVYGKTKLEGEKNIQAFANSYTIIRTAWLYSEYGNNFVKTMIRLGSERENLNVVYDQIGSPTYAKDLAKAIMEAIIKSNSSTKEILHYSNEGVCSWYDFAKKIMELKNLSCKVNPILSKDYPAPAERPVYSVLDKDSTKKYLGVSVPHWEDSLKECLTFL
jgi:dTDP-4-dehydrorhamnose reductase